MSVSGLATKALSAGVVDDLVAAATNARNIVDDVAARVDDLAALAQRAPVLGEYTRNIGLKLTTAAEGAIDDAPDAAKIILRGVRETNMAAGFTQATTQMRVANLAGALQSLDAVNDLSRVVNMLSLAGYRTGAAGSTLGVQVSTETLELGQKLAVHQQAAQLAGAAG